MAQRVEANTSRLLPKIELLLWNMLQNGIAADIPSFKTEWKLPGTDLVDS